MATIEQARAAEGIPKSENLARHPEEVDAVTGGLVVPAWDGGCQEAAQELIARQVVIQHVDTVNIYVTAAHAGGRDPQVPPIA